MIAIEYRRDYPITAEQLASVFDRSTIRRPTEDLARIQKMIDHGNLTFTAWDGEKLVGVARAMTDFSFACYLSDLAVDEAYQRNGIGKRLVELVKEAISEDSMLLLLAAPEAMEYYPKLDMAPVLNGWIYKRTR